MKEKIKKVIKKKNFNKVITIGVILIALMAVFYISWLFAIVPDKNNETTADCLKEILASLKQEWQEGCHLEGKELGEDGFCALNPERAGSLHQKYDNKTKECLEKYPIQ